MNTTFNFNRFLKVMSNEWRLNWKKAALFWGVVFVATGILFVLWWFTRGNVISRNNIFMFSFIGMCMMQGLYLHYYFSEFSSKKKTQTLLLLPASQHETFWAKLTVSMIPYWIISLVYTLIFMKMVELLNYRIWELKALSTRLHELVLSSSQQFDMLENSEVVIILGLMWLFSFSFYLFGTTLFKKSPALNSFLLGAASIVGFGYVICALYFLLTGIFPQFASLGVIFGINDDVIVLYSMYPKLMIGAVIFISLALMVIARVKYNEKTI